MTTKTYTDLTGWVFRIDEVSAGVYEVVAQDRAGREVSAQGINIEELIESCRKRALGSALPK